MIVMQSFEPIVFRVVVLGLKVWLGRSRVDWSVLCRLIWSVLSRLKCFQTEMTSWNLDSSKSLIPHSITYYVLHLLWKFSSRCKGHSQIMQISGDKHIWEAIVKQCEVHFKELISRNKLDPLGFDQDLVEGGFMTLTHQTPIMTELVFSTAWPRAYARVSSRNCWSATSTKIKKTNPRLKYSNIA